jgi:hypothetical protein
MKNVFEYYQSVEHTGNWLITQEQGESISGFQKIESAISHRLQSVSEWFASGWHEIVKFCAVIGSLVIVLIVVLLVIGCLKFRSKFVNTRKSTLVAEEPANVNATVASAEPLSITVGSFGASTRQVEVRNTRQSPIRSTLSSRSTPKITTSSEAIEMKKFVQSSGPLLQPAPTRSIIFEDV